MATTGAPHGAVATTTAGTQRTGAAPRGDRRAGSGDPGSGHPAGWIPGPRETSPAGLEDELPTVRPAAAGIPRPVVTAILVCHNGAPFLPRALAAIGAQTRPPDRLVAVDAGSADTGGELLATATPLVLRLPPTASFADAVDAAVGAVTAAALAPSPDPRSQVPDDRPPDEEPATEEWLWLLHDDGAAAPDALARLLDAVEAGPSVGVAGCKQVDWDDEALLLDVGFTVSSLGRRVTGVDFREVDQGQHDDRSDVLAVGTAGMLVRREVWDRLGGPDPGLAHARDDLDLCRRARLAGYRVIVVPDAVMAHAQARSQGLRGTADGRRDGTRRAWLRAERKDAVLLRLAGVSWPLLLPAIVWTLLVAWPRAAVRLVLKRPDLAVDELVTPAGVVLRPGLWWRSRRRVARGRSVPARVLRPLVATPKQLWRARREAFGAHLHTSGLVDEALAGADGLPEDAPRPRRVRPGSLLALGGVLLAAGTAGAVALRAVLAGSGRLTGAALPPVPDGLGQLWTLATSSWRPVGLGGAAPADPLVTVLAAAGSVVGSPAVAVEALLVTGPLLAAAGGWLAASLLVRSRTARTWAALVWAAAPPLLGAIASGRVGGVIAHVTLPLLVAALARATGLLGRPGAHPGAAHPGAAGRGRRRPGSRGAVTAASAAGLLLTLLLAAAPSLTLAALVGLVLAAVWARSGRWLLTWTLLVPAVLLLPWWVAVARHPRLLLADPSGGEIGAAAAAGPGDRPWGSPWWHLLGTPERADELLGLHDGLGALLRAPLSLLPWHLPTASVVALVAVAPTLAALAAALFALFRRIGDAVVAWWVVVAAGMVTAAACDQLADGAGQRGPWPGPATSVLLLGLLGAALAGLRQEGAVLPRLAARGRSLPVLAVAALVLGPVTGLAGWAWAGAAGDPSGSSGSAGRPQLRRVDPAVLPQVAALEAAGPAAARTLVLQDRSGALHWTLARGAGPQLGESSTALAAADLDRPGGSDRALLAPVLAALLSGSGQDVRDRLASFGIGSVLLLPPSGPAADSPLQQAGQALDVSPGLVRVGTVGAGAAQRTLWSVQLDGAAGVPDRPSRARVLGQDGRVLAAVPSRGLRIDTDLAAGPAGRTLVLAERWDPGWHAELDGRALPSLRQDGWAQAFRLPETGGRLAVVHHLPGQRRLDLARTAIAALALLVAIPIPGRRRSPGPPRSSQPIGRGPRTRVGVSR